MPTKTFIDGLQIGEPWSHRSLTVYPLVATAHRQPAYRTLDEALATGRFRVAEVSMSGTVPELKALNELEAPVLMLDGEELVGAKQNRVLNLTVLVPAKAELAIPVSCVEAGRWRHLSDNFTAADRAQFARGRARKLSQVSSSLREVGARRSDQADIWHEIAAKSARMSAPSPTAAMAAIYEHKERDLEDFVRTMPRHGGQVGAVFAVGAEIAGLDAFDCAATFGRSMAKLLRSYAVDALEHAASNGSTRPGADAVQAFLGDTAAAGIGRFKAIGLGEDLRLEGATLAGAALEHEGGIVHLVAFPASAFADEGQAHPHAAVARARMRRTFH